MNGHFGQMQRIDKKHGGYVWYKVKTTNIMKDFNMNFRKACCLGHLQCRNDVCNFFLNKCRNKIVWNGDIVHELQKYRFALGLPFCRTYNIAPLFVKLCLTCMYYIMHK
jgi:hypothetical protein